MNEIFICDCGWQMIYFEPNIKLIKTDEKEKLSK